MAKDISQYKTFAIHTLGCKVNLYESEAIANQLRSVGLIEVDFNTKADIYVINTCSVTNVADAKSRNMISRARTANQNALVIVAGCYSQVASEEIKQKLQVDIIIGNKYKNDVIHLIEQYLTLNQQVIKIDNLLIEKEFENIDLNTYEARTRAFIKIQDGCNFMCSYCTIPFTRGKQRSAPMKKILDDIIQFVNNGFKEIVLTGVNTAGYLDQQKNTFYDLLKNINQIEGNFRIRISSVEPFQINDEIIDLLTSNPKRFCSHWHICLQSGSNEVLKSMNRKYSKDEFMTLVQKIRSKDPLASISTDVIVGFVNETESLYQESKQFIEDVSFSFLHVFPYSKRNKTLAATLNNLVDNKTKTKRVSEIINVSKNLYKQYIKQFLNQEVEVLFERYQDGYLIGKTSQYVEVWFKSEDKSLINQLIPMHVDKIFADHLICSLIK